MNGNSKREKVDSYIQRAVTRAIHEIAFDQSGKAETLRELKRTLQATIAYEITGDPYRFQELIDIMNWKKPPKE